MANFGGKLWQTLEGNYGKLWREIMANFGGKLWQTFKGNYLEVRPEPVDTNRSP
jgi:hypothetical protein